ncbi:hypothetical protein A9168_03500 [Macellibacteroides sp. HH-ZS]|nr:hypothetical protein A9168_03500 [Macellibacteroides sp. HH-ZS]
MKENGNGDALFDFSLITAFRVIEQVSGKYFDAGFGADDNQGHAKKAQEKPKKSPRTFKQKL